MKKKLVILLSIFMFGCAGTDVKNNTNPLASSNVIKVESNDGKVVQIDKSSKICVFVPKDGYSPDKAWAPVNGSGLQLANAVTSAFSKYFPQTTEVKDDTNLNNAIKEARAQDYDYIIYPKILIWTDHNTFLSGVPNKAKINLRLYSLKQKRVENSFLISEKGNQYVSYGVTTVNLVEEPLKQVAEQLILD